MESYVHPKYGIRGTDCSSSSGWLHVSLSCTSAGELLSKQCLHEALEADRSPHTEKEDVSEGLQRKAAPMFEPKAPT